MAFVSFWISSQPLAVWRVRMKTRVPAGGTPYLATLRSVMSLIPAFKGGSVPSSVKRQWRDMPALQGAVPRTIT
jgi:hypothetical protein